MSRAIDPTSTTLGRPPSTTPVYVKVKTQKNEREDDDDERKQSDDRPYEQPTKGMRVGDIPMRVGDLPNADDMEELDLSTEERQILDGERRPDQVIKVPEDRGETHLDNYPKWAERREQMYPFAQVTNRKVYMPRYTLLTHHGQENEWMKTAVATQFHSDLFGKTARRWFEAMMTTLGAPLLNTSKCEMRMIDVEAPPPFQMPEMAYDPRDEYRIPATDTDDDLEEDSFTFAAIPYPLRCVPTPDERAADHRTRLVDLVRRHAKQVILSRAARAPATPEANTHKDKVNDEEHPCRRCNARTVNSVLRHYCHPCEVDMEAARQEKIQTSWRPPLQSWPTPAHDEAASKPEASKTVKSEPVIKQEPRTGVKIEIFGTPPVPKAPRKAVTYREQEDELMVINHRNRDRLKNDTSSEVDLKEEEESPLGSALSVVFQPNQRPLLRRMAREDVVSYRNRQTAINTAVVAIGKFDGTTSKAPKYMQDLCTQVVTYKFSEQEIITLVPEARTMVDAAATWLTTNLTKVCQLSDKPIQALLMRFRAHYVDPHVTRDLRKQLATTTLTTPTLSLKDLDTHFAHSYLSHPSRLFH